MNSTTPPSDDTPEQPTDTTPAIEPVLDVDADETHLEQETTPEPVIERPRFPTGNPKVTFDAPFSTPLPKNPRTPLEDSLEVPSVPVLEFNELASAYPREDVSSSPGGREWLRLLVESQGLLMKNNILESVQHQPDSEWVQRPVIDGERYGIAIPRFGDEKEGGPMVGERARARIMAELGLGAKLRIPLWHSGLYLTVKAPSDAALLDLQRLIETEKVTLGRATNGMLFSNASVVTNMHLVDFVLAHVYNASVSFNSPDELKQLILVPDMLTLFWGMLCTVYPDGYPYSRPCVTGPHKCQHVVHELLQLTKLSVTNHRKLTQFQRTHMKQRTAKVSLDAVKRYQAEFVFDVPSEIQLTEGTRLHLRHPTLADYEVSGRGWIDALVQGVDEAFAGRISAEERNKFIIDSARATAVRHYGHYVSHIVQHNNRADADNQIVDRETLEETLSDISSSTEFYKKIVTGITAFIEGSTVSMIAIPRYNCPACTHDQGVVPAPYDPDLPDDQQPAPEIVDSKIHPYLIPLDVSSLFFTIIGRRITRALSKQMLSA
jgi:hypothetical protein